MEKVAASRGSASVAHLIEIAAARIAEAVRAEDIVARIDVREFACVIRDLPSREQLTHLACKMLDVLSEPMQLDGEQMALCPSIGIAMCPGDGTTPRELLSTAGDAMHRARDHDSRYAFSDARAELWASQFSDLLDGQGLAAG
jgi:diguanylate cyclase (GGDEF)-like protein